jgi:hypothetical protein
VSLNWSDGHRGQGVHKPEWMDGLPHDVMETLARVAAVDVNEKVRGEARLTLACRARSTRSSQKS